MNDFWDTLREIFRRDIGASGLEVAVFLILVFGFFAFLVLYYHLRRKKENRRLEREREEKWRRLTEKYGLSEEEKSFLEKLAGLLDQPSKKYLLIADHHTFHHVLKKYGELNRVDGELLGSIIKKTGMRESEGIVSDIPVQRRKNKRMKVELKGRISPADGETEKETMIFDLSRGGCRTNNPDGRFVRGNDVKISFTFNGKNYEKIPASVVRTSSGASVLHLSFGHVSG